MEKARIQRNGFTLIELMIALGLAAIVLTLGVPSFRAMTQENRMVTQLNDLTADLSLARSEAIKRGASVTVCRRDVNDDGADDVAANGDQCAATAAGTVPWNSGWIAFLDVNRNSRLDNDADEDSDDEIVLRVGSPVTDGSTLVFARDRIRFDPRGFATGFAGTFIYCDSRGDGDARGRVLSNTGRLRAVDPAALQVITADPCP